MIKDQSRNIKQMAANIKSMSKLQKITFISPQKNVTRNNNLDALSEQGMLQTISLNVKRENCPLC